MQKAIFKSILIVLLFASCTPQARFNNLVKKHPYVLDDFIISQWDTVFIPGLKFDTIFKTSLNGRDTFFISKTFTTIRTEPGQIIVSTQQPDSNIIRPIYNLQTEPKKNEHSKILYIALSILSVLVLFLFGFIFGQKK